jgi:hypothetical protein
MADFDYSQYDFSQPGVTANAAYDRLLSLGIPSKTAAGAVGSLMGEGGRGLDTRALNRGDGSDGSDSIGFGQWNADRATALNNKAGQMGLPWTDPRSQIEHMASELQGSHKHVLAALKSAPDDVGAGNDIWTSKYEVAAPATAHLDRRLQNGLSFAQQVAGRAPGGMVDPETTGAGVDPWSDAGKAMNPSTAKLPVPALSAQFQQGQVNPGQGATVGPNGAVSLAPNRMLIGSNELQARGPQVANVVPRLPGETQDPQNVTNPALVGSSAGGGAFTDAFGQNPGPTPNPRFSTDPRPMPVRPTSAYPNPNYTPMPGRGPVPTGGVPTVGDPNGNARPTGALSPSFWTDQQGNILGIGNISELGKRLEKVGGWLNPQAAQGMAAAAGAQTSAQNANTNEMTAKNNVQIQNRAMALKEAPTPNAFNSDNGKFRIIESVDPRTGQITRTRQAIPEDEQDAAKSQFKPSATVEKMLAQDEDQSQKNLAIVNDAKDYRQMIRDGKVDMSLLGQAESTLRTMAGQGDEKALNALKLRGFIQQAANNQLRSEKGVQTDADAKRIMDEILSGSAKYSNKAIYDWMGKHMEQVRDDIQYRSRRAATAIKRYGPGYDPDNYMTDDWNRRANSAQSAFDSDRSAPDFTGSAPAAAAPGHIDPVIAAYRRRMGQ